MQKLIESMVGLIKIMTRIFRNIRPGIVFILLMIVHLSPDNVFAQLQTPQVDSISIYEGHPKITWFPNTDNTLGYPILKFSFDGFIFNWKEIDTVWGANSTFYYDSTVNACEENPPYKLYASWTGNPNNSNWSKALKTIYLKKPELDKCNNSIKLNWTPYLNMIPELTGYQILAKENNGPLYEAGVTSFQDTSFVHHNLVDGVTYTYMIRAFNPDKSRTSSSCERSLKVKTLKLPEHVFIRYATVENNEYIKIEWVADQTAPISIFKILRSENGINFATIGEIYDTINYNPTKVYIDETADFNTQGYYYKIRACDSCKVDMLASENIARAIHLTGGPSLTGTTNLLEWNEYEGWDRTGIEEYNIYRKVDEGSYSSVPIITLPPGTTSYTDDVSGLSNLEGSFSYYVEAIENDGSNGFEDFKDSSKSNEITIEQETKVLIPNAFTPGLPPNEEFKPHTIAFIDPESYQLSIFNKWGQMLYKTTDPTEGWDGQYNGEYVPADAYVYLIVYRTPEGQTIEKRGTVTVVR